MPEDNLKTSVLSSLFWKFLERGGVAGVQLIVQIILARLLLPADYGVIALIIVFISISQVFVQSGLGTALIQKKNVTDADYSSVFYLTLGIALVFYCLLFLGSPFIAAFHNQPLITPVLRVLGILLFFGAVNIIQNAVIARDFLFKKLFVSSLGAILLSGVVGIAMAYVGYGVWALVGQQLTSIIVLCLIMWFTVKWRPKLLFSLTQVRELFSFGWKLLASGLIDATCTNLSSLIIGRLYPASMLGYYTKGQEFPNVLMSNVDSTIQTVMFPAYAKNQDKRHQVKQIMRRALVTSSFLVFPSMAGLAAMAEPLVKLLLTEKWLMCVPFLQIFCAVYALWPIHTANLQAINALGRSDIFLKLTIVKEIIFLTVLAITVPIGIYAMAMGRIVTGVTSMLINAYPNRLLLNYSFTEQWRDVMPALILSLIMFGAAYSVLFLGMSVWATLILQIGVGVVVYVGLAWVLKLEALTYTMNTVKEYKWLC
jgi:teichuronic acid exporter